MRKDMLIFILFTITVIIIWAASPFIIAWRFESWEHRGQFGDLFGAVTSLFNALAFLGLIYTIYQQHIELGLQRQELADTRAELHKSAEAQIESQQALKQQVIAQKDSALISALDTLIRINRELISKDSNDEVAKRLPAYKLALSKMDKYSSALELRIKEYL